MSVAIRELGLRDRVALERLLDVCSPGWVDALAPGASGPLAFVADPSSFVFGVYRDGEPVGWAWGNHVKRPDGAAVSLIHELSLVGADCDHSLADMLVDAAFGLARRSGCAELWHLSADAPLKTWSC